MKVLQVGKFYSPYKGGMETYLLNLCQGLKDQVDLKVLVSNTSLRTIRETVNGVEVIRAGRWGILSATSICPSFPFLLKRCAGDIIQIQHPDPMAEISYLLAKPLGKLVVIYQSDIIEKRLIYIYFPFLLKFFRRADRIIVTSPPYLESSGFLQKFKGKCVTIPIGIDLSLFEKSEAILEKVKNIVTKFGDRIILFVGRLSLYKGLKYLIEAMEEVDGKLLIIGRGERFKPLRNMVREKGLSDKVFLLSEVSEDELPAYLHACSIFCLPSVTRNEAFGVCLLEAMACAKPIVSTRLNTGVAYINQDGITGFLIPPRDAQSLREVLNRLLADPEFRSKLGEAGRRKVEEEFTREKMVAATLSLYQELQG